MVFLTILLLLALFIVIAITYMYFFLVSVLELFKGKTNSKVIDAKKGKENTQNLSLIIQRRTGFHLF